ncbi:hypothetical protein BK796_10315 [Kosakonia pseudosacchari]|uniref:Transposase n=1 Tax=Kosakonia pseudosacchari TaxID=1646340 RepID=A0ABX4ISX4_9ENTR|nr:hypothetical protein BK796_10315 [Kosakonia pseudosacchari]
MPASLTERHPDGVAPRALLWVVFDTANLSEEEMLHLANGCEDHIAGLCHGLHFLGKTLSPFD